MQIGADVVADVDLGDIDRQDFECRARVETFFQDSLGDRVGVFEHQLIRIGRADGVDDPFADAGDNRFLGRTADEPIEIRSDGDASLDSKLDAVLRLRIDRRTTLDRVGTIYDLGIHARLHGVQDVSPRQVDRHRSFARQRNLGPMRGDQGSNHIRHVAARKVMSLKAFRGDPVLFRHPGLNCHDLRPNHDFRFDFAQSHADQFHQADVGVGRLGLNPKIEILRKQNQGEDRHEGEHDQKEKQNAEIGIGIGIFVELKGK